MANPIPRRVLVFGFALLILSYAAEKSRLLISEDSSSVTGRKFSWLDCFDLGLGTAGCLAKEGTKLYTNSFRARLVEEAKHKAFSIAYQAALDKGLAAKLAAEEAKVSGLKAGKLASRRAKRVTGPVFAAAWDLFEVMYYGGTIVEAVVRGAGTLSGTWFGGYYGEQGLGRLGFFVGSHLGSWAGGRVGLMVYDVISGAQVLISGVQEFLSFPPEETSEPGNEVMSEELHEVASDEL